MQIQKSFAHLALATTFLFVASCAAWQVDQTEEMIASGEILVDVDGLPGAVDSPGSFDYSRGSTIALVDNRFDSFSIERKLRFSIERQLRERGLTRTAKSGADYLLGYRISSAEQGDVTGIVRTMGLQPHFTKSSQQLAQGALVIAFADASTNRVLWRGSVEALIDPTRTEEDRAARIDRAVSLLLERL